MKKTSEVCGIAKSIDKNKLVGKPINFIAVCRGVEIAYGTYRSKVRQYARSLIRKEYREDVRVYSVHFWANKSKPLSNEMKTHTRVATSNTNLRRAKRLQYGAIKRALRGGLKLWFLSKKGRVEILGFLANPRPIFLATDLSGCGPARGGMVMGSLRSAIRESKEWDGSWDNVVRIVEGNLQNNIVL